MKLRVVLIIWISLDWFEVSASTSFYNVAEEGSLKRKRRFLIFEGGGNRKFTCGFTVPVDLGDKRSLGAYFSFQGQYLTPPEPIYWWDKWDGRSLKGIKEQFEANDIEFRDESHIFLYSLIEIYLNSLRKNGRKCLLRAICENAIVDEAVGIWSKIIHKILSPLESSADEYKDAYKAGRYGTDCITMYPECPFGDWLLDGLVYTEVIQYFKGN